VLGRIQRPDGNLCASQCIRAMSDPWTSALARVCAPASVVGGVPYSVCMCVSVCMRKDEKVEERVCSDGNGCSATGSTGSVSGCARGGRQGDCGEPLAMEEEGQRGAGLGKVPATGNNSTV
jgi:hypothetical protein